MIFVQTAMLESLSLNSEVVKEPFQVMKHFRYQACQHDRKYSIKGRRLIFLKLLKFLKEV